jgi:O-acetyl-ADP-ribose deacetylase (regulator of RNase III)/NAD-dependent SIR2 family protein deacetylase
MPNDQLQTALTILLREYSERSGQQTKLSDFTPQEHNRIYDQLLTIRPPFKNEELFQITDQIHYQPHSLDPDTFESVHYKSARISLFKGDITTLKTTFITNAANSALLGCFQPTHKCIDNIIHSRAGPRLRLACVDHNKGDGDVGKAFVTDGFCLPSKFVIHTVGPQVERGTIPSVTAQEELKSCYKSSMDVVGKCGVETPSIAFCCISTGLFGFDQKLASEIAIKTVMEWVDNNPTFKGHIIFNVFTPSDTKLYQTRLTNLFGKVAINENQFKAEMELAKAAIKSADYLLVSGAAGLSASAGLDYTSESVFKHHFPVMHAYGFKNFYQFIGFGDWDQVSPNNPEGLKWGYYFSQVNLARYSWGKTKPYQDLLKLFNKFDGFVTTSNADGMFLQNGFPKEKIWTIQGDYGRLQCLSNCKADSYWDTKEFIDKALPHLNASTQEIPKEFVPKCKNCGGKLMLNVRGGNWFNEDPFKNQKSEFESWRSRVMKAVKQENKKLVIIEIGAGFNTPSVLRWPNEFLAETEGVFLIRLNLTDFDVGHANGVGIPLDATTAIELLSIN